jgi:hypothetical protein
MVNVMKLIKMPNEKIGLFVLLPKGAYAIDIAASLSVFSHDPLSNGLLNGALKDGPDWSRLVKHWAHLRLPLNKLEAIALRSPDYPGLVLQSLTGGTQAASAADPIIAIEITDIEILEEQDPTGRRAMERQFMPSPEIRSPCDSPAAETAQVIEFTSDRSHPPRR